MADFLNRMLGRNSGEDKGSGAVAKDRLKMVLTHDRIQVSPEKLNEMRTEIIAVIAKYVPEIDPDSVDISIEQTDRYNNRIVAQIPFSKTRGRPTPDSSENTDLQNTSEHDATTLPSIPKDEDEKLDPLEVFNPDDDEPTLLIDKKVDAEKVFPKLDNEETNAKTTEAKPVIDKASDDESDKEDD